MKKVLEALNEYGVEIVAGAIILAGVVAPAIKDLHKKEVEFLLSTQNKEVV